MKKIGILGTDKAYAWMGQIGKLFRTETGRVDLTCQNCMTHSLNYRFQPILRPTRFGAEPDTLLWLWCDSCKIFGVVAGIRMPSWYCEPEKHEGWWNGYKEDISRELEVYADYVR